MAKYKNFGELTPGDSIFSIEFNNSKLMQNCVGNIFNRYIIQSIEPFFMRTNKVMIKAVLDKSEFIRNWSPTEGKQDVYTMTAETDLSQKTNYSKKEIEDNKINCTIYSTNVESLSMAICDAIETLEKRKQELDALKAETDRVLSTLALNYKVRKDMGFQYKEYNKIEYKEVVVTEEVMV